MSKKVRKVSRIDDPNIEAQIKESMDSAKTAWDGLLTEEGS